MASKKTQSVKKDAPKAKATASKASKPAPKAKVAQGPRHPKARVVAANGSKEALAKTIAAAVARSSEDTGAVEARLKKASNAQLLRLAKATQTVKDKFGSRDKLIAAIGAAKNKSKDKDYLAKLEKFSLHQLLDLAATAQRAAR